MKRHHLIAATLAAALALQTQAQPALGGAAPVAPVAPVVPVAPVAPTTHPAPPPPAAPAAPALSAEGRMYAPGAFDGVEIGGSADVRYVQGDADWVYVEGDTEVQRSVQVMVQGTQLRIRTQDSWKFWTARRLQVQISSRQLSRLSIQGAADWVASGAVNTERLMVHISGAGLARFDKLNSENLAFNVSGAGDGQFQGQVQDLSVQISGKSEFRGEHLRSRNARITISGIGDVKVWAVNDLGITVSGVGQVEYWGNPRQVRERTSGPSTISARGGK